MPKNPVKIKRETLSEKVDAALREMLVSGRWKNGERILSEAELADMFGVSKLTVRTAVQRLSVQGLLEIRAGDGIFAKNFSVHEYLQKATDLYITAEMMDDVCEFRKILEIDCLRLAIDAATKEDIDEMQRRIDQYIQVRKQYHGLDSEWLQEYVEADFDFHYALCKSSHNSLLILGFNATEGAIKKYLKAINTQRIIDFDSPQMVAFNGQDVHQVILNAIENKNFQKARDVYIAMIDYKVTAKDYIVAADHSLIVN